MLAIRIATTGLEDTDEIIGISIFDDHEGSVFNALVRPTHNAYWETSEMNNIHPEDFINADTYTWSEFLPMIQEKVNSTDCVIVYNAPFMMKFMPGLSVSRYIDLMPVYSIINGETVEVDYDLQILFKSLAHCSCRFGIDLRNRNIYNVTEGAAILMDCYKSICRFYPKLVSKYTYKAA